MKSVSKVMGFFFFTPVRYFGGFYFGVPRGFSGVRS